MSTKCRLYVELYVNSMSTFPRLIMSTKSTMSTISSTTRSTISRLNCRRYVDFISTCEVDFMSTVCRLYVNYHVNIYVDLMLSLTYSRHVVDI